MSESRERLLCGGVGFNFKNVAKRRIITMQNICAKSLISAVQSRSMLWNDAHIDYKNKRITDKKWNEVGEICNCTGAAAKNKWKNLKDTYRRTTQKIPKSSSGSGAKPRNIKWLYLNHMSFIKKTASSDPTNGEKERQNALESQIEKSDDEKIEKENDNLLFLKSLLPYFEKLNDIEKLEIRTDIQNLFIAKLKK